MASVITYTRHILFYIRVQELLLEVVNNANADNFLNSFKRFLLRRGCPAIMVADNGGGFVADETQKFASDHDISWRFNLDCAPWFRGVWERLVASVKQCSKKVVSMEKLTYVELETLVSEIELILNNRPIDLFFRTTCRYDAIRAIDKQMECVIKVLMFLLKDKDSKTSSDARSLL